MNPEQWHNVDDYLCQALIPADAVLDATLSRSAAAGLPAINVAPNQGKLLQMLAQIRGARRILEIGTLGGYSTIWLARALPADGELISLEAEPMHAEVARGNLAAAGLAARVSVLVGRAADTLAQLLADRVEPFDMIFIDADKQSNPTYLKLSLQLSRPGTLIICDNVVRNGRVAELGNQDPDVLGVREFFALAAAEAHLTTTAIQTVGSKGWDGFSLSIVGAA